MRVVETIHQARRPSQCGSLSPGWVSHQVRAERNRLSASGSLPFSELPPAAAVARVLFEEQGRPRECLYSSMVTLWTFLSQTLCPDHSCRQAVAWLRAFLTADGKPPCAAETRPSCKARQRLPENAFARLARDVGQSLHQSRERSAAARRPAGEAGRRRDGEHARYGGQSARVSAVGLAAA